MQPNRTTEAQVAEGLTIGVAAKCEHPLAKGLASRFFTWAEEHQRPCLFDVDTGALLGLSSRAPHLVCPREQLTSRCDVVVILGGDGTLISVCRHASRHVPKIIGVNLGTLGFLTEIAVEELFPVLESTVAGKGTFQRRTLLHTTVSRKGETIADYFAINDVVITKEALARIFGVDMELDGAPAAQLRGDGLIVASPSGSTAYSLAAGGSIVHPEVEALLLTPICPHSLTSRPLVLPKTCQIKLRVASDSAAPNDQVYLTIDGQTGMELLDQDEILVTSSEHAVDFVRSPSRNYFQVLATKLKWANR